MKRVDLFPRLFRPRRFRWRRVADIRSDLSVQRYYRTKALIAVFKGEIQEAAKNDSEIANKWNAFVTAKSEIEIAIEELNTFKNAIPSPWWCPKGWSDYYQTQDAKGSIYRRISHLSHELHVLAYALIPFNALEANLALTLYDFKTNFLSGSLLKGRYRFRKLWRRTRGTRYCP